MSVNMDRLMQVIKKQKAANVALLAQIELLLLRVREVRAASTALEQEVWALNKEINGE